MENRTMGAALSVGGICSEEELEFLHKLGLSAPRGEMFVELGTYQGRTAAILCGAAEVISSQVVTIDSYGAETHDDPSLEAEEYALKVKNTLADLGFYPRVIIGDSAVVPDDIHSIGLLFIDTEHTRERLYKELDVWLPLLVQDGILAFHDYNEPGTKAIMTPAIDERIRNKPNEWECLGIARWLIGFRRL